MIDSMLDTNVAGANGAVENERWDPKPALAKVVTDEDDEGELDAWTSCPTTVLPLLCIVVAVLCQIWEIIIALDQQTLTME